MPTIPDLPPPAQPICCEGIWQHTPDCATAPLDQIGGEC